MLSTFGNLVRTMRSMCRHPLNRGQRMRAVRRFVRWQVASRLSPGPIIVPWIRGARFIARRGDTGLTGNIYSGLHEFEQMGYLLHVLRPEDVFVDVGANMGSYTLLASAVIGARSLAFEPVPTTFERLRANLEINALGQKVQAFNRGLADKNGRLLFTANHGCGNHIVLEAKDGEECVTVDVTTLDSALQSELPALIKIDTEGFEELVVKGAQDTLRKPSLHSIIIELEGIGARYGFDEGKVRGILAAEGFVPLLYDPFRRKLTSATGTLDSSRGTVFVRNRPYVQERLEGAQPFEVQGVSV